MAAEQRRVPERGRGGRHARRAERLRQAGGEEASIAAYFKERVYATFTGLAIVLVAAAGEHPEPGHAVLALALGVLGITIAGFASEVISHLAVHRSFPDRAGFVRMLRIAGGALSTVFVPGLVLALAWLGVLSFEGAVRTAVIIYIVTLAVIGWFAVRRSRLAWWQQLVALVILLALGLVVILLQTIAHSV